MKILVTGGAGFIGSHIVDGYIDAGHEVIVIDNFSSGRKENVNPGAVFVEGDITDRKFLDDLFQKHSPFDLVNHHAAQKSVSRSLKDPVLDADINIMGSLFLLETMRKFSSKRIIFSSTGGAIYKEGCQLPAVEEAEIEPISPYAISKYSTENYLRFYRELGFTTQIFRYANVYGPRQDPEGEAGVIAIFCSRLYANKNLVINGDGMQTRDFIYVEDIVAANLSLIDYKKSGTWNIGTGEEVSINNVADRLMKIVDESTSVPGVIEYQAARLGELRRSALSAQRAIRELEWKAQVKLSDGLRKTFETFQE